MKGYKVFDKNLCCKGVQFEVGKTYELNERGYDFYETIGECYYPISEDVRICEVEALDNILKEITTYYTNKIVIVRELSKRELEDYEYYCSYFECDGYNCGEYNQGENNSGDFNYGNNNCGDFNKGSYNVGFGNKGSYNVGFGNKGNYQFGIGCTNAPVMLFNKPTKYSLRQLMDMGVIEDIERHILTDAIKALDTFDMAVWEELGKVEEIKVKRKRYLLEAKLGMSEYYEIIGEFDTLKEAWYAKEAYSNKQIKRDLYAYSHIIDTEPEREV